MGSEKWETLKLGDVLTLKRGYDLTQVDRKPGKVPVISSSGFSGFHNTSMVKGPGVVTGRYGTLGELFYVEEDYWPHNTTLYVRDFKGNDPRFIFYLLKTLNFGGKNDKTSVPGLNRNDLHLIKVSLPPLPTQRRIASILTALDDKIELNRRMNKTLEGIAQAVWGEWFGKYASGEEELPTETMKTNFEEHLDVERGLSYKGDGLVGPDDGGAPMYNLNSVLEGGGFKYSGMKYYSGEYKERHLVNPGELIVTNTEQGHKYLLIGYPAVIPKMYGPGICSHHIYRVRTKPDSYLTSQFFYYLMMHPIVREQIVGCANGTTVNMLKIDGLRVPEFSLPPKKLVVDFSELAQRIWDKQEENNQQSRTLTALRDALLPRLMRGEIIT
jgi:type I restriction enzyme S subunit